MNERLIWPASGRYIIAVSGGVDSMMLLDVMARSAPHRGYELVIAHLDHGIRTNSSRDALLVRGAAERFGLAFELGEGHLGNVSEAVARTARHSFLEVIRSKYQASAIVTAHHQDDAIETSLLNLARGTGRRGISPLLYGSILRPLIDISRTQIIDYAGREALSWHEDETNLDLSNPRNFLRHELIRGSSAVWRSQYVDLLTEVAEHNIAIDEQLGVLISRSGNRVSIDRFAARDLSLGELEEVIVYAARALDPSLQIERRLVQELALFAKVGTSRRARPLGKALSLVIESDKITMVSAKNPT